MSKKSLAMVLVSLFLMALPVAAQRGARGPGPLPDGELSMAPLYEPADRAYIPNQYVIVYKKDVSERELLEEVNYQSRSAVDVSRVYTHALRGFTAVLDSRQLEDIRLDPRVEYVERDFYVHANVTWGLDRTDQRNLPLDNVYSNTYGNGAGVHVYVIDTGIRASHSEFSGRVGNGYDAVDNDNNPNDCQGHGTHVAGTTSGSTYGMAPASTVHGVRVLNCSGSGSNSGVIAGVNWVVNNAQSPAVANMSLGGGASTALDNAVNNAVAAGITFVVAAGNENQNACNVSPARAANAITVGSTTSSDGRSSFSNWGSCVDIFAPGSSITSAWYTGNNATNTISGTSMASPHVAGAAATYLGANPGASPAQVTAALVNNASSGKISSVGSGSPNLLLYVGGGTDPDPDPDPSCTGSETYTGSLTGTGDVDYQPNGTYYYSASSGTHSAQLEGAGPDFDLYLWKWNGSSWSTVASSLSSNSSESINYNGTAGYYVWRVYSYSGSGSYELCIDRP